MPKDKSAFNPFYALLIVAGVAFCITACAYGVMVFLEAQPAAADRGPSNHPLLQFLARYGATLLFIELAVLAVATFGAIGTDGYWKRRVLEAGGENVDLEKPERKDRVGS